MNFQYGGKNVLAYGLTFDLDDYEQFYQRVWRDGQEEGVIMYNLVAEDTVDDVMLEVLAGRSRNQRALLNALKRRYKL
jgi:SNF2 family DNA or RNA helicase